MADQNDTRQQGIEFGEFGETMDSLEYPIDHADLIEQHGDAELELPNGTSTLAEVLEPLQDEDQTYQDRDELETMILNMVGDEAIGRKNYSDRDPPAIGEESQDEGAPGQTVEEEDESL
ncbi:MAG TPA: DUF5789 family protein [Halococcus sp.]|nr:DUF5789 family protein [Halococcus sp.]